MKVSIKTLKIRAASGFSAVFAFDLGTSPHGLTVSVSRSHQETGRKAGARFPAKPVLTVGQLPPSSVAGGALAPAPAARPPAFSYSIELSPEQLDHVAFAVLCQVDGLQDSREANEPEVLEAIRSLASVQRLFRELASGGRT